MNTRQILYALGFIEGNGFKGEVWSNPESEWMAQVWITLEGELFNKSFDARNGFDLNEFFSWWEDASFDDFHKWERR